MKPYLNALAFLLLAWILEFLFRMGLLLHIFPLELSGEIGGFSMFACFTVLLLLLTHFMAKKDASSLSQLGINFKRRNRLDFLWGCIAGIVLWAVVSQVQAYSAGFTWEIRPSFQPVNLLLGFFFIFIADLGTELFYRGYPLTELDKSWGAPISIGVMVAFVGLKSFSPNLELDLQLYTMIIPALHTIFFSIIYLKTKRIGGALGLHTGANFVTISLFDLRHDNDAQFIPSGWLQPDTTLDDLSLNALQWPWIAMPILLSIFLLFFFSNKKLIA